MSAVAPLQPPSSFIDEARSIGIEFEAGDVERLGRYLAMLLDANTRFNLTAVAEPDKAWRRHVLDSLTLVPYLIEAGAQRVIDVGSGGGLPGIPLAIALPQIRFALLEATGKKARFLQEVVNQLALTNADVINDRAEIIGQDHQRHREQYDVVIARAVGRLPVLLELAVPLARIGGHVLAMKGAHAAQEIDDAKAALHKLHAHVTHSRQTATGTLVIVEKMRRTPRCYPRKPGEPKRLPL